MHNYNNRLNFNWIFWISIAMIFFGISPFFLLLGLNLGNILLLGGGIFFISLQHILRNHGKWFTSSKAKENFKRSVRMLELIVIFSVTIFTVHALIWNYFAYFRKPLPNSESTVIVLGCKINDQTPSLMLKRRLDSAITYLKDNPKANCVVSGGMGIGESFSEAFVMKKYMLENGIEENRVFPEDKSTNTATNLKFSAEVIKENNLNNSLVISTDAFHQLRAFLYANKLGFSSKALSCHTSPLLVPGYAVRELGGILKFFLFDQLKQVN